MSTLKTSATFLQQSIVLISNTDTMKMMTIL